MSFFDRLKRTRVSPRLYQTPPRRKRISLTTLSAGKFLVSDETSIISNWGRNS